MKRTKLLEVKDSVVEGYQNGATLRDLAIIHNVSTGTVRNLLLSNNVPLRSKGRRKKNVQNPLPQN